jgi:hypothetical protein
LQNVPLARCCGGALVISQWYRYSLDSTARNKIRRVLLDWTRLNIPDGNPINETHFEGFLKAIRLHRDFVHNE